MVNINIEYTGDLRTQVVHGPSGSAFLTDAPLDNQGQARSISPTDMLAASMGSCMLTIMGILAKREGWTIEGAAVTVNKEMSTSGPRRIAKLTCVFTLPAALAPEQRHKLELAARACPVHKSIHPDVEQIIQFNYA